MKISLCTGRAASSCKPVLTKLSLDGLHVFCDGALVCDAEQDKEVYVKSINEDLLKRFCTKASEFNLPIELYTSSELFIEQETWITDIQRKFFKIEPQVVNFNSIFNTKRIIKGGMIVSSPEEEARTLAFSFAFNNELDFSWAQTPAFPGTYFINVTSTGVSKGKALEALSSYLEIDLNEVIAIGDGINDISLLSTAGLSIAMGNASQELKAIADYVTANVEQSGVAQAIHKFLL
jgi:5-amino-6-(5-phospho-D-ribitylamino)uracil phosphatase